MTKLKEIEINKATLTVTLLATEVGSDKFNDAYLEYKKLLTGEVTRTWSRLQKQYNSEDEAYFYNVLNDHFMDKAMLELGMTAERLAGMMRIDDGLKVYCKKQIGKGKSFGSLEYSKVHKKTSMIEAALALL